MKCVGKKDREWSCTVIDGGGNLGESPALNTKVEESFFSMGDDKRHAMEGTTEPKVFRARGAW